jgi:acetyl esterase/lipase
MKSFPSLFLSLALVAVGSSGSSLAAEMVIHRDIAYAEPKNERQCLDVYSAAGAKEETQKAGMGRPVVVWIHGGGWHQGDKSALAVGTPEQHTFKPQAIVDRGGVFVAINYRFVPNVDLKAMTGDVAKAIAWVKRHVAEYGGDPETIMVMGHSAGAQLAALVCTDERYLQAEGLTLRDIKGCMPVDGAAYFPALQAENPDPNKTAKFRKAFPVGSESELSSVVHIAKDKGIPPFLVICLADRPESHSKLQSEIFVHYLTLAGVPAKVVPVAGKTHETLNADLGLPNDEATKAMLAFVDEITGGTPQK